MAVLSSFYRVMTRKNEAERRRGIIPPARVFGEKMRVINPEREKTECATR